jgi:hypothetical protein
MYIAIGMSLWSVDKEPIRISKCQSSVPGPPRRFEVYSVCGYSLAKCQDVMSISGSNEPKSLVCLFSHVTFHLRSSHISEQLTLQRRSTTQGTSASALLAHDPFAPDLGQGGSALSNSQATRLQVPLSVPLNSLEATGS